MSQSRRASTKAAMRADRTINAAYLGAHTRWEIIRYRTATLATTDTYVLSGLLRGMRGTEEHIDSHVAGDTFVGALAVARAEQLPIEAALRWATAAAALSVQRAGATTSMPTRAEIDAFKG